MTDRTPTTDQVRHAYRDGEPPYLYQRGAEFDRWLRQVQADAWSEGIARAIHGTLDELEWMDDDYADDNPYKERR